MRFDIDPAAFGLALGGARVAECQNSTQIGVTSRSLYQQSKRYGQRVWVGTVSYDRQVGPDDSAHPGTAGCLVKARNPVDTTQITERQRVITKVCSAIDEILRVRGGIQKRKSAPAAEFDVLLRRALRTAYRGRGDHMLTFALFSLPGNTRWGINSSCRERRPIDEVSAEEARRERW